MSVRKKKKPANAEEWSQTGVKFYVLVLYKGIAQTIEQLQVVSIWTRACVGTQLTTHDPVTKQIRTQ